MPDAPDAAPGALDCEVIALREWGSDELLSLRGFATDEGSERGVPRPGVEMMFEDGLWRIRDWRGIAGLRHDGAPVRELTVAEGAEIGLGGMTLVAESARSLALRALCARLIGWSDERGCEIDQALRAIRAAGRRRTPLFLRGEGDLALVAQAIHRHTLGPGAPFLVADPRRGDHVATVRNPASRADGLIALRDAAGGSVCVRESRLPASFDAVLRAFGAPDGNIQLVVCARPGPLDLRLSTAALIQLPALASRASELRRLISAYAMDATAALGVPADSFTDEDLAWVGRMSAASIPDIEKATLRLVAVRVSRDRRQAADLLGMAPVSLARWLGRRTVDPQTGEPVRPPAFRHETARAARAVDPATGYFGSAHSGSEIAVS